MISPARGEFVQSTNTHLYILTDRVDIAGVDVNDGKTDGFVIFYGRGSQHA